MISDTEMQGSQNSPIMHLEAHHMHQLKAQSPSSSSKSI